MSGAINPRNVFTGEYYKIENSEFEDEYQSKVPSEREVQLVATRNRQCLYYWSGIENCRRQIAKFLINPQNSDYDGGFIVCKHNVDQYYSCITQGKYGKTLDEAPEETQSDVKQFYQCAFQDVSPIYHCKRYFDGVLRTIVRQPNSQIDNS